jgi:hypothetical protein
MRIPLTDRKTNKEILRELNEQIHINRDLSRRRANKHIHAILNAAISGQSRPTTEQFRETKFKLK